MLLFQSTDPVHRLFPSEVSLCPVPVLCSRLMFDLQFTFILVLITLGRLYYPLLTPSKVFNAYLSTYCVSSCRHS